MGEYIFTPDGPKVVVTKNGDEVAVLNQSANLTLSPHAGEFIITDGNTVFRFYREKVEEVDGVTVFVDNDALFDALSPLFNYDSSTILAKGSIAINAAGTVNLVWANGMNAGNTLPVGVRIKKVSGAFTDSGAGAGKLKINGNEQVFSFVTTTLATKAGIVKGITDAILDALAYQLADDADEFSYEITAAYSSTLCVYEFELVGIKI